MGSQVPVVRAEPPVMSAEVIGGEPVSAAMTALESADAAVVLIDGKPAGIVTRQDLLGFLAH